MRCWIISEIIYLFGGWDGNEDLADMWAYHIPRRQWTCIAKNSEEEVTLDYLCLLIYCKLIIQIIERKIVILLVY